MCTWVILVAVYFLRNMDGKYELFENDKYIIRMEKWITKNGEIKWLCWRGDEK